ncbi:hypothetical protein E3V55_07425 [Candidatus Marinimicrobia bacterium MT.SAG.3]|nr:hypothetical protein E3V55_07425 [Candidatus Marinimicrobia bacterium MT.SAG.3]
MRGRPLQYPFNWIIALAIFVVPSYAIAGDISGNISVETRLFPQSALSEVQGGNNLSLAFQPEYYLEWSGGYQSFTFAPYYRYDQTDDERTHFDLRELQWQYIARRWEFRAGYRRVFWGVIETYHLVDVINQTDLVENIDFEDKLGQPMLNLALINDWGTIDLFLLLGFRERTFAGEKGRLRFPLKIDTKNARYESSDKEEHIDFAVRYEHSLDIWDFGISFFDGTNRDPTFRPLDAELLPLLIDENTIFVPYYEQMNQTSLDLQGTFDSGLLLKLEAISRANSAETFFAASGGLEYTFYGIKGTNVDAGLLLEYHYDERGLDAPTPFQDDLFIGTRIAMNDVQSSDLLAGAIIDLDTGGSALVLETTRRIGANWKIEVQIRAFVNADMNDALYGFRKDDMLQIELFRYF